MAEYFVFVVNADTVAQRKVSLGQRIRDMVIVKSGLQAKEIIVLDGVQKLKDGSKVHAPLGSRFIYSRGDRFFKEKIIVIQKQYDCRYFY